MHDIFLTIDYILVPTPYYGGFDKGICHRSGVKIYPVDCTSDNNFMPTVKLLEDTLVKAKNEVHISLVFCMKTIYFPDKSSFLLYAMY